MISIRPSITSFTLYILCFKSKLVNSTFWLTTCIDHLTYIPYIYGDRLICPCPTVQSNSFRKNNRMISSINSYYLSVREIIVLKNESFRRCINVLPKTLIFPVDLLVRWRFRRHTLRGTAECFAIPLSANHCIAILYFTQKIELSPR